MTVSPAVIDATGRNAPCTQPTQGYDELVDADVPSGPRDQLSTDAVLDVLPTLPNWPPQGRERNSTRVLSNARAILEFLATYPGTGWQQRWVTSGADKGIQWLESLEGIDTPDGKTLRRDLMEALPRLLLCRIFFPSYEFLTSYRALTLYSTMRQMFRPDLFAVIESRLDAAVGSTVTSRQALVVISKIVLHTGRDVNKLTADDLLTYRAWFYRQGRKDEAPGSNLAWTVLHGIADLGEHSTMRDALRLGQRPTHELVDAYHIRSPNVREVLIKYLDERRPALDYTSFQSLVSILAGVFWSDIERHHPDLDTLEPTLRRGQVMEGTDTHGQHLGRPDTAPRKQILSPDLRSRLLPRSPGMVAARSGLGSMELPQPNPPSRDRRVCKSEAAQNRSDPSACARAPVASSRPRRGGRTPSS